MESRRFLRSFIVMLIFFAAGAAWCSDAGFAGRTAVILPIRDLSTTTGGTDWRWQL